MKIAKLKIENYKEGYTVVELLFYIALFALLSIVVIDAMITMTKSFRETSIQAEWIQGSTIMERISREVRQAEEVTTISASSLELTNSGGTVEFVLSGTNIQFLENDVFTGDLNTANIVVTGLTFTQITTTVGEAVKIALTIRSTNDAQSRTQNFYNTVVLRGKY